MACRDLCCILVFCVLSYCMQATAGEGMNARCINVKDGDTLVAEINGARFEINIKGVDAPELGQPFGDEAENFLSSLVLDKDLHLDGVSGDVDRSLSAHVTQGDIDLAKALLEKGLAWHDTLHGDVQESLVFEQLKARSAGLGLWSQPTPVPPWQWRSLPKMGPTPTPQPRRLAEVASKYHLEKNSGNRTVIHQPPPRKRSAEGPKVGSGRRANKSGNVTDTSIFGGPKCCCELESARRDQKGDELETETIYRRIDVYSCEHAFSIVDLKANLHKAPKGCVGDYLCE